MAFKIQLIIKNKVNKSQTRCGVQFFSVIFIADFFIKKDH